MTHAVRVLAGLLAGFLVGFIIPGGPAGALIIGWLEPVGTIFVNLIRVTAIPIITTMLLATLGGTNATADVARAAARALVLAIGLLVIAATVTVLVADPILHRVNVDQAAALALRSGATMPTAAPLTADAFVPSNVMRAAANGEIVPVIVFTTLLGLALARVRTERRDAVLRVIEGVAEAVQRLVGWILIAAPIGVFALAVPLAARLGLSAAGVVVAYIALVVGLTAILTLILLYPIGVLAGPLTASAFVAACAAPQSLAFAARSSLAAVPAMADSAERAGLTSDSARFLLPLAATLFHFGAAIAQTVGALFVARLYGIDLSVPQLTALVAAVVIASFAVPGIPGGSIIGMVPVLTAVQLPIEGIGILLAVDTIPDMFRTAANTTGAMMLTIVVPRRTAS